ncbi:MAG: electron transfer flavoprotein beta subunit/FixA family protein [Propionibacteriaceae bacterium]|jgi:electron transfer flavoprotein beta subunit|nr:electron transfer flavoprotein beta subunit/FixA family protein [Propionibacteriaceae bacterium]
MRIVVAHKWAADPQEAVVGADGAVDWSRARPAVSEYDAVAIAVGRQLADASGAELVGLSVGGPTAAAPLAAKAALARGLDSALIVADPALAEADSAVTAQVLAAAVTELGQVGLVLTGDCSVDRGARLTPAVLAGWLDWVCLAEVSAVRWDPTGLSLERESDGGWQSLTLSPPAVLALAAGAVYPPVPGMKDVLAAARKPIRQLDLGQLGLELIRAPLLLAAAPAPAPDRRGVVIDAMDPALAAAELVARLSHDGLTWEGRP